MQQTVHKLLWLTTARPTTAPVVRLLVFGRCRMIKANLLITIMLLEIDFVWQSPVPESCRPRANRILEIERLKLIIWSPLWLMGLLWRETLCQRSLSSIELHWAPLSSTEFHWVPLSSIEQCFVRYGFNEKFIDKLSSPAHQSKKTVHRFWMSVVRWAAFWMRNFWIFSIQIPILVFLKSQSFSWRSDSTGPGVPGALLTELKNQL